MAAGEAPLYLYALADERLPRRLHIERHVLRVLRVGQVHAVVEPHDGRVDAVPETLQEQHAIVVRLAARSNALLPARFGSVLGERLLRSTLAQHQAEIIGALALVRGRAQMTIRVFGAPDAGRPPEVRTAGGAAFLESRRARARHVPGEVGIIRAVLGDIASAERIELGIGTLRVTVCHLVAHDALETYRRRAAGLPARLGQHQVMVTGPWPVFAFAPDLNLT
jgi:hypothetical protein